MSRTTQVSTSKMVHNVKKKISQKIVSRGRVAATSSKTGTDVGERRNAISGLGSKKSSEGQRSSGKRTGSSGAGLSQKQQAELLRRLEDLRSEIQTALLGKADSFNMAAQAESLIKGDDAEVAEKQRMNNAALQELDFLKSRLGLVQRALAKIEAGVYGLCEETEEPIGFERLSVVPWARFAVHVQEVRERKLREYRGSRLRSEV